MTILEEEEVREVSAINNYLKDHFLTEKPLDYKN